MKILEHKIYKVTVTAGFMDMSGTTGDPMDGPRWTGGYNRKTVTVNVIASRPAQAREHVINEMFRGYENPVIDEINCFDVHGMLLAFGG